jgi:hypothetical protein
MVTFSCYLTSKRSRCVERAMPDKRRAERKREVGNKSRKDTLIQANRLDTGVVCIVLHRALTRWWSKEELSNPSSSLVFTSPTHLYDTSASANLGASLVRSSLSDAWIFFYFFLSPPGNKQTARQPSDRIRNVTQQPTRRPKKETTAAKPGPGR